MVRYIDAELLKENFAKKLNKHYDIMFKIDDVAVDLSLAIADTPTADVVEVKYGEWKHKLDCNGYGCYECSKCNTLHEYDTEYCPNCGAKMGGKV